MDIVLSSQALVGRNFQCSRIWILRSGTIGSIEKRFDTSESNLLMVQRTGDFTPGHRVDRRPTPTANNLWMTAIYFRPCRANFKRSCPRSRRHWTLSRLEANGWHCALTVVPVSPGIEYSSAPSSTKTVLLLILVYFPRLLCFSAEWIRKSTMAFPSLWISFIRQLLYYYYWNSNAVYYLRCAFQGTKIVNGIWTDCTRLLWRPTQSQRLDHRVIWEEVSPLADSE
jgi:hypothetical protein